MSDLHTASFQALMYAATKKLGHNEALVLVDISEDDPSSEKAWVYIGDDGGIHIPRRYWAHGRRNYC